MSFDEAITASSGQEWDAEDFQKCRDEIPVQGCSLAADSARSYRPALAGMELLPTLEFNEDGQLTDLRLGRSYRAGVTAKQCEAMHARLLDYLTLKYGRARANPGGVVVRSPGGNIYHRSEQIAPVMVAGIEDFRTATDGSNISLLTTFTTGSRYTEAECSVNVYIDGPKSLQRRPLEKVEAVPSREAAGAAAGASNETDLEGE